MTRLAFSAVFGFVLGVGVMDWGYEKQMKKEQEIRAEQVRKCQAYVGYLVIALDGRTTECRSLMPRADWMYPLPPEKVRRRRAIGG